MSTFILDATSTCDETADPSFVRGETTILASSINRHTINEDSQLDEDEEISKLILLFSKQRPYLHDTQEPLSKKMFYGSSTDLPPPAVFRRKIKSGVPKIE